MVHFQNLQSQTVVITLPSIIQILRTRAFFMQRFCFALHNKLFFWHKADIFRCSGLTTKFVSIRPKRFKKPELLNSASDCHKQDIILTKIIREIQQTYQIFTISLHVGVYGLKTHFGSLEAKGQSHKSRSLGLIVTNKT